MTTLDKDQFSSAPRDFSALKINHAAICSSCFVHGTKICDQSRLVSMSFVTSSLDLEEVESSLDVITKLCSETQQVTDFWSTKLPVIRAIQRDDQDSLVDLLKWYFLLESKDDSGNTAVQWAIKKNKPVYLKMLLEKSADPNTVNHEGVHALHSAVDIGNEELLDLLLLHSADVNVTDANGQTAAHYAVYYGNLAMLNNLINNGIDINVADTKERTALFLAVWKGQSDMVQLLLENNADMTRVTELSFHQREMGEAEKVTPVMYAAAVGFTEGLQLLINFGADPHFRDNANKRSALFYAALYNQKACVDVILKEEKEMQDALTDACKKQDLDYVKLLAEFKPKVSHAALNEACQEGKQEIIEILLDAGGDINPFLDEDARTPLMAAAAGGKLDTIKFLLDQGAVVNQCNGNKQTALHIAVLEWKSDCVELLLEKGADPKIASCAGTPLMCAVKKGTKAVKLLLEHGCDVNFNNGIDCAVTLAAGESSSEKLQLLMDHGASLDVSDVRCWSPVMIAASQNREYNVKLLLENGANVNHSDNIGTTALHIAAQKSLKHILQALLSHQPDLNAVIQRTKRCMPLTPLTCAIRRGWNEGVMSLLEHGASADIPKSAGLKGAMVRCFRPRLVRLLLAAGAEPDCLPDAVCHSDDSVSLRRVRYLQPTHSTEIRDIMSDTSLFHLCRMRIRRHLARVEPCNVFFSVHLLPLPNIIISSLLFDVELQKGKIST